MGLVALNLLGEQAGGPVVTDVAVRGPGQAEGPRGPVDAVPDLIMDVQGDYESIKYFVMFLFFCSVYVFCFNVTMNSYSMLYFHCTQG